MGARDRRTTDDQTETSTETAAEVGEATGTNRRGARVVGRDGHRTLRGLIRISATTRAVAKEEPIATQRASYLRKGGLYAVGIDSQFDN